MTADEIVYAGWTGDEEEIIWYYTNSTYGSITGNVSADNPYEIVENGGC